MKRKTINREELKRVVNSDAPISPVPARIGEFLFSGDWKS